MNRHFLFLSCAYLYFYNYQLFFQAWTVSFLPFSTHLSHRPYKLNSITHARKLLLNTNIQEKYESPFFIISMQHINEIPYCMYIINVILLGYSKHERKLLNHSYIRF